jgi:hypothetical protein
MGLQFLTKQVFLHKNAPADHQACCICWLRLMQEGLLWIASADTRPQLGCKVPRFGSNRADSRILRDGPASKTRDSGEDFDSASKPRLAHPPLLSPSIARGTALCCASGTVELC